MKVSWNEKIKSWVAQYGNEKSIVPHWTPASVAFKKKEKKMLSKEQIKSLIEQQVDNLKTLRADIDGYTRVLANYGNMLHEAYAEEDLIQERIEALEEMEKNLKDE